MLVKGAPGQLLIQALFTTEKLGNLEVTAIDHRTRNGKIHSW